jgi:chemosensory pili system protein ChpA (sensor histidine kinase/response regulator)
MSIVRESVLAMKGTIDLTTRPQFGTTFTIRVPQPFLERRRPRRTLSKQTADSDAAKIVLIVDDSPSVRLKTSRVFRGEGWRSETAANGFEALEKLRLLPRLPDAILSDIEMPIMGGYEFVGALRADEALKEIPVIFISSRSGEGERNRALASGVNEYFTKPCDDRELLDAVEQLRVAAVPA